MEGDGKFMFGLLVEARKVEIDVEVVEDAWPRFTSAPRVRGFVTNVLVLSTLEGSHFRFLTTKAPGSHHMSLLTEGLY